VQTSIVVAQLEFAMHDYSSFLHTQEFFLLHEWDLNKNADKFQYDEC